MEESSSIAIKFNSIRLELPKSKNGSFGFITSFLSFISYYDVISAEI